MLSSRFIDLRSDTVTRPSPEMREAVLTASLGDDVFQEDPSTLELEQYAAHLLNKQAALYVPSGTMSNLLAMMTHCQHKGQSAIMGDKCHINNYENGGIAGIAGVMPCIVHNNTDGTFDLTALQKAIPPYTEHIAQPQVICMENSVCNCSGAVIPLEHALAVRQIADQHNLRMHLDGARMTMSCAALGVELAQMAEPFDSVSICMSKGIGAPMGSLLLGTTPFIKEARKYRKMVGGGMRQSGIMAAQALVGLKNWKQSANSDISLAKQASTLIHSIPGLAVIMPDQVQTNIFRFLMTQDIGIDHLTLCQLLKQQGIFINASFENDCIRLVTHKDVNSDDIHYLVNTLHKIMKQEHMVPLQSLPDLPVFRDRNCTVQGQAQPIPTIMDLRSDTVTLPSAAMRDIIANAPVGDDCYQDDQQVIALQQHMATLFGKQAGLFMPSGTMANLVAIMGHCQNKGDAVIIGRESHLRRWERGNIAAIANVMPLTVDNDQQGQLDITQIQSFIQDFQDDDPHFVRIKAIAVESTHNYRGGQIVSMSHLQQLSLLSKQHNLRLHLDGARVFSASVHLGVSLQEYCSVFDTISVCLSKALGCPIGSLLLGSHDTIHRAWSLRKALGGNLRQIGGLAQAALHSLSTWQHDFQLDHHNAQFLAHRLAALPGVQIIGEVTTNIIKWTIDTDRTALCSYLAQHHILTKMHDGVMRLVTHRDMTHDQLVELVGLVECFLAQL